MSTQSLFDVVRDVVAERRAQDAKFGAQSWPDGTDAANTPQAEYMRDACERVTHEKRLTWAYILAEEFWEAMAETDTARLRAELIQVAAVAVHWVEDIDARTQPA